eukprot:scaffold2153_cov144-Skeletonema_menzelii.AAC.9
MYSASCFLLSAQSSSSIIDEWKAIHHAEEAAIGGHPDARYLLGCFDDNIDRAVKHWIIAATQGYDDAIKILMVMDSFGDGLISKEDLAAALRAHQAAVDATKSPQRNEAKEHRRMSAS